MDELGGGVEASVDSGTFLELAAVLGLKSRKGNSPRGLIDSGDVGSAFLGLSKVFFVTTEVDLRNRVVHVHGEDFVIDLLIFISELSDDAV